DARGSAARRDRQRRARARPGRPRRAARRAARGLRALARAAAGGAVLLARRQAGRGGVRWRPARCLSTALPAVAPPRAKAGGGWEEVVTGRADPKDTPPQPSPAFAGEGAKLAAVAAPTR